MAGLCPWPNCSCTKQLVVRSWAEIQFHHWIALGKISSSKQSNFIQEPVIVTNQAIDLPIVEPFIYGRRYQMKNDPRSCDRNFYNCVKKPEKNSGLQRGLNPWPREYRCDALPTELWSHWRWEQVNCGFICSRERYVNEWCIWKGDMLDALQHSGMTENDKNAFGDVKSQQILGEPFRNSSQISIDFELKITDIFGRIVNYSVISVYNVISLARTYEERSFIWTKWLSAEKELEVVDSAKLLGVTISSSLS